MNLVNYKQNDFDVLVNTGKDDVEIVLPSIKTKSKSVSIDIEQSIVGRSIIYSLSNAIPDDATVLVKNLVFYGFIEGNKRIVNVSTFLTEKIVIDNIYYNPSLKIHIEFEKDGKIYNISDEIILDVTKTIELDVVEPETKYINTVFLMHAMLTRINKLEDRILRLEKKQ